ncbi:hypothetical protein EC844_1456 [Acinetobacter calcoaceticus]|uniref:Lipoprotein n=1 Tax=Acinetobacter calcoaceticus TaxID=471 RepID=A0A4R1XI37_ACICA|nr:hypothetical protein EC844_1456 [Acinetobacter calcoaceticus]
MMLSVVIKSFYICLFTILVCACQPSTTLGNEEKKMSINEVYQLGFGLEGEQQFIKYSQEGEDRQPAGMGFYNLLWNAPNFPTVNINLGENSLIIPNTISVLGTKINYDKSMQGIQIMDINAGLNQEEYVTEEQAYQTYKLLFEHINSRGWKQYFDPFSARIHIKDNIKSIEDMGEVVDSSYFYSFEEWSEIFNEKKSIDFKVYASGIILYISVNKTDQKQSLVQYMLRFSFESVKSYQRNLITDSYKMNNVNFEQAFNKEMQENIKIRKIQESNAIAKGYRIDENYKDPDVWQYVK